MSYRIVFEKPAEKVFKRLPKDIQEGFARRLTALAEDPRPPDSRRLERADNCYRIRQGEYRLVYTILEDAIVVLVLRVGHRSDIYRDLRGITQAVRKRRRRMSGD